MPHTIKTVDNQYLLDFRVTLRCTYVRETGKLTDKPRQSDRETEREYMLCEDVGHYKARSREKCEFICERKTKM